METREGKNGLGIITLGKTERWSGPFLAHNLLQVVTEMLENGVRSFLVDLKSFEAVTQYLFPAVLKAKSEIEKAGGTLKLKNVPKKGGLVSLVSFYCFFKNIII